MEKNGQEIIELQSDNCEPNIDENEDLSGDSENDLQACSVGKDLRDTLPSFENPLKTTKGRSTSPSLLAPSHKLLPPLNNIVQVNMLFLIRGEG